MSHEQVSITKAYGTVVMKPKYTTHPTGRRAHLSQAFTHWSHDHVTAQNTARDEQDTHTHKAIVVERIWKRVSGGALTTLESCEGNVE